MTLVALEVERNAARAGNILAGKYRLGRLLDRDGTECAYLAVNEQLDLQVVVKMLRPAWRGNRDQEKRFYEHASRAAQIRHPNIASVLDAGLAGQEGLFVVLEHARGVTLRRFIARERIVGVDRIGRIMEQLLGAMAAIHRHHLTHGNVTIDSVLVETSHDGSDLVKLIDFGPGRQAGGGDVRPGSVDADLHGAACVLRDLLSGHIQPTALDPVLLRARAQDPAARFQSAGEMLFVVAAARSRPPA